MTIRLALIGVGRWGTNIKKTLEGIGGVEVLAYDTNPSQPPLIKGGARSFPPDKGEVKGVSGVLIATPGSTHAEIALPFIKKGLPVFIEKPMTTSVKDALKLERAAQKSGANVFVGHLHLYNPAFLKAKELVREVGKIRYATFQGMNWGPFRDDMSAWWDWAPHDIYMTLALFGKPKSIQAWGTFDWAQAKLTFEGFSVLIHVTWLAPERLKRMTVVGEHSTVVFQDTQPSREATAGRLSSGKITLVANDRSVSYPEYDATMSLTAEMKAFLETIKTGQAPKTDIQNGVEVVKILAAGEKSMKRDGKEITL